MEVQSPFKVIAENYQSDVHNLTTDLIFMTRNQKINQNKVQIDAYGEQWMVAFADIKPDQIAIRHGNELIPLVGSWGVLVGDYSIAEWSLSKGEMSWQAMTSVTKSLPEDLNGKVIIFSWNKKIPRSIEEVCSMIIESNHKIEIESQRKSSAIAAKTKKYLDNNFSDNGLIQTVAEKLGLSWAVMTREFRKTYGLSPVEYRHKLRVFKAVRKLSTGFDVTSAMAESGFTSASQFFIQFKKHLGTNPNSYHYNVGSHRN
jgi:AraC-like DNA-binding protein